MIAFLWPLLAIAKGLNLPAQFLMVFWRGLLGWGALCKVCNKFKEQYAISWWNHLLPTQESFRLDHVITKFLLATCTFGIGCCARFLRVETCCSCWLRGRSEGVLVSEIPVQRSSSWNFKPMWYTSKSFLSCETPCEAQGDSQIRLPTSQKTLRSSFFEKCSS